MIFAIILGLILFLVAVIYTAHDDDDDQYFNGWGDDENHL